MEAPRTNSRFQYTTTIYRWHTSAERNRGSNGEFW